MAKFLIQTASPDGPITKEEIEAAMFWMQNHDGVGFRCMIIVTEIERDYRLPKVETVQTFDARFDSPDFKKAIRKQLRQGKICVPKKKSKKK